ncbi:hypothetical protein TARUN_7330 [Trichoderma arundinaceum]|uniref:Zn(2)-C6 fungal-type domain-containing protein n=1 Tax=Trichoderma arundinaceum TaxID=490622 RepID=A0A395NFK3_TRIAR|nr:hypothetical protein TARUN_7330 [Trichoderma arundinaceum]
MGSASPKPTLRRRSRNGCRECRRRHRRCDEVKPFCGYCFGVGIDCVYSRELSWGGRPFRKSRFGQCLKAGVGVFSNAEGKTPQGDFRINDSGHSHRAWSPVSSPRAQTPFVYSTWPTIPAPDMSSDVLKDEAIPRETCILSDGSDSTQDSPDSDSEQALIVFRHSARSGDISQIIASYPDLHHVSVEHRNLLAYFQHQISKSLSCHEGIQSDICSSLIPMAMNSPHLLAAMLCAASCHRMSIGLQQDLSNIVGLRSLAIEKLRDSLESTDEHSLLAALGTSLVLCVSDIVSADNASNDWMIHLFGASALLKQLCVINRLPSSSYPFLIRFYTSLKTISAGNRLSVRGTLFEMPGAALGCSYIDDLAGFSNALAPIFEMIAKLKETLQRNDFGTIADDAYVTYTQLKPTDATTVCIELIKVVQSMLACRSLEFRSEICDTLSEETKQDFLLLDEAYHHMALLQLYDLVSWSSSLFGGLIQESVRNIIRCVSGMDVMSRPCPGVATLPVLFQAGCSAASQSDRMQIRELLLRARACFGMGNVINSMKFLDGIWGNSTDAGALPCQLQTLQFLPY